MNENLALAKYTPVLLPMKRILNDHQFNCRGRFSRDECRELAGSIKRNGLDVPVQVRPIDHPEYDHQMVSGHRRFVAMDLNGETVIPAIIRTDLNHDDDARDANLRENIERLDLSLMQEAKALTFYFEKGYSDSQISARFNKSDGWVATRRRVIDMPFFVQQEVEKKTINSGHINQLWAFRHDPEKLSDMIRRVKEMVEKGERSTVLKKDANVVDFARAKKPKQVDLNAMLEVIARQFTRQLPDDEFFAHRLLAWTAGYISEAELYTSMELECNRLGLVFEPSPEIKKMLKGV